MMGFIYKIIHRTDNSILPYIGSTKNKLAKRMASHRSMYKAWEVGKIVKGCSIFPLFREHGIENFIIVELARYEVEDKQELIKYEMEWINKINCCNTKRTTGLSKKELDRFSYQRHREDRIEKVHEYASKNKDAIKEKGRIYREKNKDTIREKKRIYAEKNKDAIRERKHIYTEKNKDAIKERRRKRRCDLCNSLHSKEHMLTYKHIVNLFKQLPFAE